MTSAGSTSLHYDTAGRCDKKTETGGDTLFALDYEDRITQITYPDLSTNTFAYNGLGSMVGKNDSSGSYTYFRNGSVPGSGVISDSHATYTGVVSERRNGASKWMHQGVSGSNVLMTDASGNVTDTRTFDAFGGLLGSSGSSLTPFGFGAGFGLQHEGDLDGWIDYWRSLIMIQKAYTSLPDGGSMGSGVSAPPTKPRPMYVGMEGEGGARIPDGPISSSPVTNEDQSTYFNRVKPEAFSAGWEFTNHLFWLAASFVPIEGVVGAVGNAAVKGGGRLLRGAKAVEGAVTKIAPNKGIREFFAYLMKLDGSPFYAGSTGRAVEIRFGENAARFEKMGYDKARLSVDVVGKGSTRFEARVIEQNTIDLHGGVGGNLKNKIRAVAAGKMPMP